MSAQDLIPWRPWPPSKPGVYDVRPVAVALGAMCPIRGRPCQDPECSDRPRAQRVEVVFTMRGIMMLQRLKRGNGAIRLVNGNWNCNGCAGSEWRPVLTPDD